MLYFLSEEEREDNYFRMYNQALRSELNERQVSFRDIPLVGSFYDQIKKVGSLRTRPDDIWLLSYAHNPIIQWVAQKPGRKFAHAHGLEASLFEPAVLEGYDLHEAKAFREYDGIFVNSEWSKNLIADRYPQLQADIVVSGFPFDQEAVRAEQLQSKTDNLIAFNQRFSLDKLHILEVHLAERLISAGYMVMHLCPRNLIEHIFGDREARALYRQGLKRGLRFVVNDTKAEYYRNLSRAQIQITTSAADTLSIGTLEAATLGATPLAPDWGPFPEYLPEIHLYPPYNIDKIMTLVSDPPVCKVDIGQYAPEMVFARYFEVMETF